MMIVLKWRTGTEICPFFIGKMKCDIMVMKFGQWEWDLRKHLGWELGFVTLPHPFRTLKDPLVFVASAGCAYFASEKNNALPSSSYDS